MLKREREISNLCPFFEILALMLFPENEDKQNEWFACALAGAYVSSLKEGEKVDYSRYHRIIPGLWILKRAPQQVFSQERDSGAKRAQNATILFEAQLCCAVNHPQHWKAKNRLELFRWFLCELSQGKLTDSNLMKDWANFKSVVHLWSAYNIVTEEKRTERIDSRESLSDFTLVQNSFLVDSKNKAFLHGASKTVDLHSRVNSTCKPTDATGRPRPRPEC